jgi:hypothetical protein
MRLLRLTTQDSNALFDATFNENIVLPKNSKIALQNISIEADKNVLIVDASNNIITYQLTETIGETQVALDFNTYTGDNYQDLLTDIENKLNANTGYTVGSGNRRELGIEWRAIVGDKNKVQIENERGESGENFDDWYFDPDEVTRVTTDAGTWGRKAGEPASADFNANMNYAYYIARGNGYTRCKIHTLVNPLSTPAEENGFILGLSSIPLQPDEVTLAAYKFGLFCSIDSGGTYQYQVIVDGVLSPVSPIVPNFFGVNNPNNDFLEVTINKGNVVINRYANGSSTPDEIAFFPYTAGQTLYPINTFFGRRDDCKINNVRVTDSPFQDFTKIRQSIHELSVPPQRDPRPTNQFLNFGSIEVAKYLGYKNQRQPQSGFIFESDAVYLADFQFNDKVVADAFLIELLNIPLESYDSFVKQRKNILAVVPESDKTGVVIYEPSTPFFIDVKNEQDLLLRNIRARVVAPDYTPFAMRGLATLTLLID